METINDVIHYMSKLTFVGYLEDSKYENFDKIRIKFLEYFFGHVDTDKLVYLLNNVDDIKIPFINCETGLKTDLLDLFREMIFNLIKERSVSPEIDNKFMTLEEVLERQKRDNGCKSKRKI